MLDEVMDLASWSASFVPLLVLSVFLVYTYRRVCFWIALRWVPGPPALPILGNALLLTGGQDGKTFRQLSDTINRPINYRVGNKCIAFSVQSDSKLLSGFSFIGHGNPPTII
jgi:hypothetical protein